jgi:hypothetical protein
MAQGLMKVNEKRWGSEILCGTVLQGLEYSSPFLMLGASGRLYKFFFFFFSHKTEAPNASKITRSTPVTTALRLRIWGTLPGKHGAQADQ